MNRTIFAIVGMSALLVNAQVAQEAASGTESLTPLQSTQATCLDQCHVADTGCRAECISVHNPSVDPITAIQKCQAGCVQGDGSVEQTSSYGMCLRDCIDFDSTAATGVTAATTAASFATGPAATTVGTPTVSKNSASSSSSATGSAADAVRVGTAGLGLFGLLAVIFM